MHGPSRGVRGALSLGIATALAVLAGALPAPAQNSPVGPTPIGLWRTVDDNTGRERALVRIYETPNGLNGRIERIFDADRANALCQRCGGDRKDRPVIGLEIIRGLRPDGSGGWERGEILDPESGSTYRATATLRPDGGALTLRGSVLGGLIGRSQTWLREGPAPR